MVKAINTVAMAPDGSRLAWLAEAFGLSSFDIDLMLIALAPEPDLRYEHAYLQDNVSRRCPRVELALSLLCPSAEVKLVRRARFGADAALILYGLLHRVPAIKGVLPPPGYVCKRQDKPMSATQVVSSLTESHVERTPW